jgi:orotidine-5'-phosphate decarboxylase
LRTPTTSVMLAWIWNVVSSRGEERPVDPREKLIVALDTPSLAEAEAMAARLDGIVRWFKVGSHLYTAAGPAALSALQRRGRIFLDLKYHDIPSVVEGAVEEAARQGVAMCTVHAVGGSAMMRAAQEGADRGTPRGKDHLRVIGVTLLTSGDATALSETGISGSPLEVSLRLARLAQAAGLAGAVTSPLEVQAVRAACGAGFLLVCPGIRAEEAARGDQRRVRTAREAVAAGADMVVVGRPITQADDPRAAAEEIIRQIAGNQPTET